MGKVVVELRLENTIDREMVRRGLMKEDDVRKLTTEAVVDSEAVTLVLPQDQVEALGLREMGKALVICSDQRKEERMVAGVVTARIGNRFAEVDCVVGQPASQPILGRVPLRIMDLHVDYRQQKLVPRPESPFLPMYELR